jgi:serine/threonine protein kinase
VIDLKPDNVGFTKDGQLKLFDFGLVTCVHSRTASDQTYEMTGYTGSLRYMAPEVVQRKPYTEKADVYSFGIMLWQMARDKVPFKGFTKDEFIKQVVVNLERPKCDKSWPVGFTTLLKSCWDNDVARRPSFLMIVQAITKLIAQEVGESIPKHKKTASVGSSWFTGH